MAIAFALGVPASGVGTVACSSSPPPTSSGPPKTDAGPVVASVPVCKAGGLHIAFNPMYSAYDGKHIFKVPAVVYGSNGPVTWEADPTMVAMQSDSERPNEVLIQMLKAGSTSIYVRSADGTQCGSAPLYITAALESDWEIGNARYNNGKSVHLNTAMVGSGSPLEQDGGTACTNCHGETATQGPFTDVSHTPEQTGGFSDTDILNIVLHGMFPPGAVFDNTIVGYQSWQGFHQWADIRPDQQRGIIVYLRSLTPAPQNGAPNFNAFDMDAGSGSAAAPDAGE